MYEGIPEDMQYRQEEHGSFISAKKFYAALSRTFAVNRPSEKKKRYEEALSDGGLDELLVKMITRGPYERDGNRYYRFKVEEAEPGFEFPSNSLKIRERDNASPSVFMLKEISAPFTQYLREAAELSTSTELNVQRREKMKQEVRQSDPNYIEPGYFKAAETREHIERREEKDFRRALREGFDATAQSSAQVFKIQELLKKSAYKVNVQNSLNRLEGSLRRAIEEGRPTVSFFNATLAVSDIKIGRDFFWIKDESALKLAGALRIGPGELKKLQHELTEADAIDIVSGGLPSLGRRR